MEKISWLFFVIVCWWSCEKPVTVDEGFQNYIQSLEKDLGVVFLENENGVYPPIELLEVDTIEKSSKFYGDKADEMIKMDGGELNDRNNETRMMAINYLALTIPKEHENGPRIFSPIQFLESNVVNDEQTDEDQFLEIINQLVKIEAYFQEAKKLIKNPAEEKLKLAITQYSKDYFYLKNKLPSLIRKPDILKEDQISFSQKNEKAQIAIKDFLAFLNSHLFEIHDRQHVDRTNSILK